MGKINNTLYPFLKCQFLKIDNYTYSIVGDYKWFLFSYYFCVTPLWGGTKIFAYALTKTKR